MRVFVRLLRNVHAGEKSLVWHHPSIGTAPASIVLSSSSFGFNQSIPRRHAGAGVGDNISPALAWSGAPSDAEEFALIIEDPDAPLPRPFVHAIVVGIPSDTSSLAEKALCALPPTLGMLGRNSFRRQGYAGPRALPGHGPHKYAFQLFALRRKLTFERAPDRKALLAALEGTVIARGRLDGTFERP
jgi:hypothetical protein